MTRFFLALAIVLGLTSIAFAQSAPSCATITHTLATGSRGPEVNQLQTVLGIPPTGYFGAITKQKLMVWQLAHKVITSARADGAGIAGPKTRAALRCTATTATVSTSTVQNGPLVTAASSTATTTASTTVPSVIPVSGASASAPVGPMCTPIAAQAPTTACAPGSVWQVIQDEAGCDIWYCVDNPTQG